MSRTSNFTDAQKAHLYVLHRATCVYSGHKLWILDGGARRGFMIDWADHVRPVAKGGRSTLDNGVCASWVQNFEKRDSTKSPVFLFYRGRPQAAFYRHNSTLPRKMLHDLARLANLHHSDWYFNRALFRVLLGVEYLDTGVGVRRRDDKYYASAALKAIRKWRAIVSREPVPTLEKRRLASMKPSRDQKILLSIREAETIAEVRSMMKKLLPFYRRT